MAGDFDPPLEKCLLCGGARIGPYHRDARDRRIHRCDDCGIQFMNPQYSDRFLAEYYSTYIRIEPETEEPNRYLHNRYLDLLEKHTGGPGRLLDIGCGRGYLLRAARDRGWGVEGQDVDPTTVAAVSAEFDLKLHAGDFLDLKFDPPGFDLVTMHHVLEHLKDPGPVVAKVRRILRPGGIFFVALPNIRGLSSRWKFGMERVGLRRRNLGAYYDADHHLFYYEPATLRRYLADQGFTELHRQSAPKVRPGDPSWLRTLRRITTDRLLLRSSFMVIAGRE